MLFQFNRAANQHNRNEVYQVWTHENQAVEIDPFSENMAESKLDYIHNNPVRAGWVCAPEDYLYSSAVDYCGKKGLIKLEKW